MTTYGTIYLFLSYFAPLFVLGDDNVPISNEAPVLRCDGGICTLNTTGTNFELSAELLEKQIGPDVVIINQEEHFGKDSFKEGVIIVAYTHDVTRVSSALLSKTAVVDFGVYHQQTGFTQNLLDSPDGTVIGVVKVARPIHDPDTRFASLAQDPLLAGIPIGLRSEVDPAALIPSPTKGCDTNRCVAIIPGQSADVFYFGPDPTNTACLSAITNPPPLPTLPQVNMYETDL
ncbi:MAG: hypothetical protein L6R42_005426 [Xanthoria sp. 1 TBL-2021]|nr:MAG: hypothetical protein L6R42_005426 [Xanthoria sp. 1 TBL-2021]